MSDEQKFPPRGSGVPGMPEAPPMALWAGPERLGASWDWRPGSILLGRSGERLLGPNDDRHVVTIAGNGSGKTSTVLKHNLAYYPGSVIVTDPKGELARATYDARVALGQRVYVLDPFDETGLPKCSYNPFGELGFGKKVLVPADAALLADALIIPSEREPHWTDSARNLIRGIVLHLIDREPATASLRRVRSLLHGTPVELDELAGAMADSAAFDGVVANEGRSFLGRLESGSKEISGILSTAQSQTAPLDDVMSALERSDFSLADLKDGKTTIYIVLPAMRMSTHFRFMRLLVQQALAAMERHKVPRGGKRVLFMLEEFASLGAMKQIETAAGLFRGYGTQLWTVLQDLTQLKNHYPKSWETFIANAYVLQAFANADVTTTEYLSKRLGTIQMMERQDVWVSSSAMGQGDTGMREHPRTVNLLDPSEIAIYFARETGRQLILVAGRPPIYMDRMPHYGA